MIFSQASQRAAGLIRALRWRAVSMTDQLIFSAASLGSMFVYARLLTKLEFGYYAIVVSICVFAQSAQRAFLILPMIVSIEHHHTGIERAWFSANRLILFATLAAGVLGAGLSLVMNWPPGTALIILLSAVSVAGYLWFDFSRRCFYLTNRSKRAFAASAVYLLSICVPLGVVWALGPTFMRALIAYAAGNVISALIGYTMVPAPRAGQATLRSLFAEHKATALWSVAALAPFAIYTSAMPTLTALFYGPAATGVFSATRTLIAPVNTLISAVDNVDKPRASRAFKSGGVRGLFASIRGTAATLLGIGLPYLLPIAVAPAFMARLLLGQKYASDGLVAQMWAVSGVFMLLNQALETAPTVLGMSHNIFLSRMVGATILVGLLFVPISSNAPLHAVTAVVCALLVNTSFILVILWRVTRKSKRAIA